MYVRGFRNLFSFKGYVIEKIDIDPNMATVTLRLDKRHTVRCPECGSKMGRNRAVRQSAWDMPLGTALVVSLEYEAVQGKCSSCGKYSTVHPEGIDGHSRATNRLIGFVSSLCRFMPLSRLNLFVPVPKSTAYRWDKRHLSDTLPEPNLDGIRILLVDEKSVRKGHGYVTVVINGETGELLHMAEGKKKASLQSFFDKLTAERKSSIVAVAMDRGGAYYEVVKANLPGVDVVYDKFHLLANYNAVIDEVRRTEWRKAKAEEKDVIKGQRYNLFRNSENLGGERKRSLSDLLKINGNINAVYVLKDSLRKVYDYERGGWAKKALEEFISMAKESGIEPLTRFARGLSRNVQEVVNYCKHRITTGRLEGFNNTISRIIHRACGVRDMDYLFLKLRQESLA